MPIGRAIVALALAVAVALLPASAGATFAAQVDAAHTHAGTAAALSDADPATPCDPGNGGVDDCASIAVCALKCFTYADTRLPSLSAPLSAIRAPSGPAADKVDSAAGAPPFRPPRA